MKQEILTSKKYKHFVFNFQIPVVRLHVKLTIQAFPEMKESLGITNRTHDGYYVVFLDYDEIEESELGRELDRLQADFNLTEFFVFKLDRPNSWHAICLKKMPMRMAQEVILNSSADTAFKNAPIFFRRSRWILRIGPKGQRNPPKFHKRMGDENHSMNANIDLGMLNFFHEYYGVELKQYEKRKIEASTNLLVQFQPYNTFNRV